MNYLQKGISETEKLKLLDHCGEPFQLRFSFSKQHNAELLFTAVQNAITTKFLSLDLCLTHLSADYIRRLNPHKFDVNSGIVIHGSSVQGFKWKVDPATSGADLFFRNDSDYDVALCSMMLWELALEGALKYTKKG
jgi:hypothetical protein